MIKQLFIKTINKTLSYGLGVSGLLMILLFSLNGNFIFLELSMALAVILFTFILGTLIFWLMFFGRRIEVEMLIEVDVWLINLAFIISTFILLIDLHI